MTTIAELVERLTNTYRPDTPVAAHIWTVDDVNFVLQSKGDEDEQDFWFDILTEKEKEDVINYVDAHKDSDIGICWQTIQDRVDEVLEDKPKQCGSCEHIFTKVKYSPAYEKVCPNCGSGNWLYGTID